MALLIRKGGTAWEQGKMEWVTQANVGFETKKGSIMSNLDGLGMRKMELTAVILKMMGFCKCEEWFHKLTENDFLWMIDKKNFK